MTGQVTPGTLTFQPGPDHPFGYSRMDVVWSGFIIPNDPGTNYWLNFGVRLNDGSSIVQCVDVGFTQGSKHPSLTTGTVSASSSSVQIIATDIGSLNLTAPLTLFSIYYVSSPGTTVTFTWRTSPPNQVIDINNLDDVSYPALGSATVQEFPARTISGGIYKPPFTQSNCGGGIDAAVTGVTVMNYTNVDCSPAQQNTSAMNQNNGQYAFVVNEKFNYTVRPVKSNNPSCGVNTLDVTMVQQHANGSSIFHYPWQVIAGDMNLDNRATTYDAVLIQKLILGTFVPPNGWDSWTFPTAIDYGFFPPVTSPSYAYPAYKPYFSFVNLSGNQPFKDFVGIKRADVDGSCSDCNAEFNGEETQNRNIAAKGILIENIAVEAGATIELPVRMAGWEKNTSAVAFALFFPTEYFDILGVKGGGLPHFSGNNFFNWDAMSEGLLRFGWVNLDNREVNLSEDAPLFYIELKAKRSAPSLMGLLQMRPDVQDCSMATSDLERSLLNVQISGQASPAQGVIVYPNPAKEVVHIGFDVPSNGAEVLVRFYGSDGRLLLSQVSDFAQGRQTFTISTSGFPSGLVTYSLLVGDHRFTGRFVKQY